MILIIIIIIIILIIIIIIFKAEERADLGDRTIAKLQKECDRLEGLVLIYSNVFFIILILILNFLNLFKDELLVEKEKLKNITEELEQTVNELQGY
jgi:hypothetical protein